MIPHLLHFVWVGPPMPDLFAGFVDGWADLHPSWDVKVWGEDDLTDLTNQAIYDSARGDHAGQLRSDVARYEILRDHGGVYLDCDMEPLRPIDGLCGSLAFAAWETDSRWVGNAVLGSVPGHPLWGELIAALPASVAASKPTDRPTLVSGPQFFTPRVRHRTDVRILSSASFYPYRWDQLDRASDDPGDAYAVHHWNNARRRKGVPLHV